MPRGGFRPGAGRKRGVPNSKTAQLQAEVAASGETPLQYMLRIMRDENASEKRRDEMARAAAPFVHARLQAAGQRVEMPEQIEVTDAREKLARLIGRAASDGEY